MEAAVSAAEAQLVGLVAQLDVLEQGGLGGGVAPTDMVASLKALREVLAKESDEAAEVAADRDKVHPSDPCALASASAAPESYRLGRLSFNRSARAET
jgi:hypothetical protein